VNITEAFAAYDADVLYCNGSALKTRKNYRASLHSFVRSADAELPVQLITYSHIIAWKQHMAHCGMQPSSMASNLSRFREVMKYLKKHGFDVLDWRDIERPKVPSRVPVWLELQEVQQFIEAIVSIRDRAIFACLFASGARISELLQLDRDSIINGEAEIIGKGDKPGKLSFDDTCLAILKNYTDSRADKQRPLFLSGQHRRITVSRVEQLCHEYADKAGIEKNVTPHVWRHTFATDLKNNGMDLYDLSKQLRHSRISSTMIYVHADSKKRVNYQQFHSPVPMPHASLADPPYHSIPT
jgi:site-specific recombinase XerD